MKVELYSTTCSVDLERRVLTDIRIDYSISEDLFVMSFTEDEQGHASASIIDHIAYRKFDAEKNKFVFTSKLDIEIEKALDHWLSEPNLRYSPTPQRWMEEIRSLSMTAREVGREQAMFEAARDSAKSKNRLADHVNRPFKSFQNATTEVLLNKLIIAENKVAMNGGAEDAVFVKLHYEAVNAMQNVLDHIRLIVLEAEERGRKVAA